MTIRFALLAILITTGCAVAKKTSAPRSFNLKVQWIGAETASFIEDLQKAQSGLAEFSKQYGWTQPDSPDFISEVRHFASKDKFDAELSALSPDKTATIPKTFVATMDSKILRVVSWDEYKKIHPTHEKANYVQLLQHELAHQLHVTLVGDEGMGPTWFYEGFAVVAAGQYPEDSSLAPEEVEKIIRSEDRGDYKSYARVIRLLMKKHSLPTLVEWARLDRKMFISKIGNEGK